MAYPGQGERNVAPIYHAARLFLEIALYDGNHLSHNSVACVRVTELVQSWSSLS